MQGKLITIEGIDGAGKSTQIELLGKWLESRGIGYRITSDLGETEVGKQIREILLADNSIHAKEAEALLIATARVENIRQIILPSLMNDKVVICDRYIHSTYAYQGYGRRLEIDFLKNINRLAIEKCMPDFTIFLDISPVEAHKRKKEMDRIEKAELAFHERVYRGYHNLLKGDTRMVRVEAMDSIENINKKIVELVKGKIC